MYQGWTLILEGGVRGRKQNRIEKHALGQEFAGRAGPRIGPRYSWGEVVDK